VASRLTLIAHAVTEAQRRAGFPLDEPLEQREMADRRGPYHCGDSSGRDPQHPCAHAPIASVIILADRHRTAVSY
jgi:hypothetical protein